MKQGPEGSINSLKVHLPHIGGLKRGLALLTLISLFGGGKLSGQVIQNQGKALHTTMIMRGGEETNKTERSLSDEPGFDTPWDTVGIEHYASMEEAESEINQFLHMNGWPKYSVKLNNNGNTQFTPQCTIEVFHNKASNGASTVKDLMNSYGLEGPNKKNTLNLMDLFFSDLDNLRQREELEKTLNQSANK